MNKELINNLNLKIDNRVYKQIGNINLSLKIYKPENWSREDKRSAIIFFFGGGWVSGDLDHFEKQSRYLASRGMMAITPEYRIKNKHNTTPFACVEDGKSAVNWVAENADNLGIDRDHIAVAGGSAGGHVAACTVLIDDMGFITGQVSNIPRAMVLYNPVLNTTESGFGAEELGNRQRDISPIHHLDKNVPPTIIFHGTSDQTVPYANSKNFCEIMQEKGNHCELISYEEKGHGFFNYEREEDHVSFFDTLEKTEEFLKSINYL